MITYFKYTDGSAFSLNNEDYRGMINVIGNKVYSGSTYTSNSKLLSSKKTFLAGCYENRLNFNFNPSISISSFLSSVEVYPRSILNIETLNDILYRLNYNNLLLYSKSVYVNQNHFNPLYKSLDTLPYTHTLSSKSSTLRPQKPSLFRLPLSGTEVPFFVTPLPSSRKNTLFVCNSSRDFKYFNNFRGLQGTINTSLSVSETTGIGSNYGLTHEYLHFDRYTNTIYQPTSTNYSIFTFNYKTPTAMVLLDRIDISEFSGTVDPKNCSFGKNYRCVIAVNLGEFELQVYRLRDNKLLKTYTPEDLGVSTFLNICQRFEDDALCVFAVKNNQNVLQVYDIPSLLISNKKESENIIEGDVPTYIEFCPFDSDLVILRRYDVNNNINYIDLRSITAPRYSLSYYKNKDTIVPLKVNLQIDQITLNINECPYVLGGLNLNPSIFDIQFNVSDYINTLTFASDSFITDNNNIYQYLVDTSITQNFKDITIEDSSIGLVLNTALKAIIQDTLTLYYNYSEKRSFSNNIFINTESALLNDVDLKDFTVYGNESINISVLNRMLKKINTLQSYLAGSITST